jgi:hypothetical protein
MQNDENEGVVRGATGEVVENKGANLQGRNAERTSKPSVSNATPPMFFVRM